MPKPLIPVLGVPCIEFALTHLKNSGVGNVVVNTHAHAEQLRHYLNSNPVLDLRIQESSEEKLLLGSAGGFKQALSLLSPSAFFSMNADVIHFADLAELARAHACFKATHGVLMTLVLASGEIMRKQTGEYTEIFKSGSEGLIDGIGPKKTQTPFYTGTAIFEPEAFASLTPGKSAEFAPEILLPLIQAKKVAFIESDALWIDIGTPELWALAHEHLTEARQKQTLPSEIENLLNLADPTCHGNFSLGKNKIRLEDIEYEIKDLRNP
jgi:NDP-sugar pyrophosphorylase family protein